MKKISTLRKIFKYYKIDGYIVPKNDEFFGEYVHHFKDRLKFISSFTGSFGYALILKRKSYLFVDGRYTLQALKESKNLFKIIEIHKQKPKNIINKLKNKIAIGYDSKLLTKLTLDSYFKSAKCSFVPIEQNLIDKVWSKKNDFKINKFYILPKNQAGEDYKNKIKRTLAKMQLIRANKLLISAPENIAWLMNIRGKDSDFSPLPNCNAILDISGQIDLIVNEQKINEKFLNFFKNKIRIIPQNQIVNYFIKSKNEKNKYLVDILTCSMFYEKLLKNLQIKYVCKLDPIYFLKCKKNKKEIINSKKSHLYDGVALTKFIFWIKNNVTKLNITELSAQKKLENFRKKNRYYKFPSFNTISGSGPNGAIVHYRATKNTNRLIKKNDIYLCDSGGQYHYGTTDVTRTICFSKISDKIKNIFTRVLKGHIGVVLYNLKNSTTGKEIDLVARSALKKVNLDYAHGTGHGVGYFLNVHEGPQGISKYNNTNFEEGMIISNEPGYYKNNKFGIRIENLIYVKKYKKKLKFSNLTYAPIEKDLVNYKMLNNKEKKYLNFYHKKVYSNLHSYLNKEERVWLKSTIN